VELSCIQTTPSRLRMPPPSADCTITHLATATQQTGLASEGRLVRDFTLRVLTGVLGTEQAAVLIDRAPTPAGGMLDLGGSWGLAVCVFLFARAPGSPAQPLSAVVCTTQPTRLPNPTKCHPNATSSTTPNTTTQRRPPPCKRLE